MSLPRYTAAITLAVALTAPLGACAPSLGAAPAAEAATTPVVSAERTAAASPRADRSRARAIFAERTIAIASNYKGVPYRFGGTTPRGFDCSGYTRFVLAKLDKRIPRTSQQQFEAAQRVKHPRVGDLLFYHSGSRKGRVYHVAIYAGKGKVWHAPNPGTRVKKGKIYAKHWTAGRF